MSFLRDEIVGKHRLYHLLLPFTLVWLIKPFYHGTRLDWIALAFAWPLFFSFYALAHARSRALSVFSLSALTLLGALYVPLNPEASGIFAFVAAIVVSRGLPVRPLWAYLGGINGLLLAEALVFHLNLWTWIGGGSGAVLVSFNVLLTAREREANLQLRAAQEEIGRLAQLAERARITRDLHDVLGHTLSLIAMKSELAQKRFSADPQAALSETEQIEVIARQALVRVREVIHGYTMAPLAQEIARVATVLRSVGLSVECSVDHAAMTSMQESVFAMILQEASTNILRHAHARCCRIAVQATEEAVQLLIIDDGQGAAHYDGFGLRGMRERLRLLGGSLDICADYGTHLRANLPR